MLKSQVVDVHTDVRTTVRACEGAHVRVCQWPIQGGPRGPGPPPSGK